MGTERLLMDEWNDGSPAGACPGGTTDMAPCTLNIGRVELVHTLFLMLDAGFALQSDRHYADS